MSSLPKHIDAKYLPIEYGGLLNFPLDQGLNQFSFFYKFNDEYESEWFSKIMFFEILTAHLF